MIIGNVLSDSESGSKGLFSKEFRERLGVFGPVEW